MIFATIASFVSYMILEATWLHFAKPFYKSMIKYTSLSIKSWTAAVLVYIIMLLSYYYLVIYNREAISILDGVVYGLAVYGVYNLTNKVFIDNYPWSLVIMDTVWGTFIFALITLIYKKIHQI